MAEAQREEDLSCDEVEVDLNIQPLLSSTAVATADSSLARVVAMKMNDKPGISRANFGPYPE